MILGEPTVSWPTDPNSFYIHVMYNEFFYGPYASIEEIHVARKRLDERDEMWNYDCDAIVKGDLTPVAQRRIENLTYVSKRTGKVIT
jgi:hypothetical protein